jgi:hypothetical protein
VAAIASLVVLSVLGGTLVYPRAAAFERRLVHVLVAAALLLAGAFALQMRQQHVVDEAFRRGGEAYEAALVATEPWSTFARWAALETLIMSIVVSLLGIVRRIYWAVPILLVLLVIGLLTLLLSLRGGIPRVV